MRPLLYLPGVDIDLANGASWYEGKQPGLGKRFLAEFDLTCHRIPFYPEMYPLVHAAARRALIHVFKYAIYYRVTPEAIEIIAVLSTRIDPDITESRLLNLPH